MMMADSDIKAAMQAGDLVIGNFNESSLQASSYDARVGQRALLGGTDAEINIPEKGAVTIRPGEFVLIVTREKFKLNATIAGNLGIRSYYSRKGLVVLAGLQVDPGFEGHLVIGGFNAAPRRLVLDYESPFVTVEFHRLAGRVEKPFVSGEEQKLGHLPRADKDYLRTLETQSLSDVAGELSNLARSVGAMQTQLTWFYTPLLAGTFVAVVAFGLAALLK